MFAYLKIEQGISHTHHYGAELIPPLLASSSETEKSRHKIECSGLFVIFFYLPTLMSLDTDKLGEDADDENYLEVAKVLIHAAELRAREFGIAEVIAM